MPSGPPGSTRSPEPVPHGCCRSLPGVDAFSEDRVDLPMARNVPRSPTGYLMELERLTAALSDEDRELVLQLARRLAGRG